MTSRNAFAMLLARARMGSAAEQRVGWPARAANTLRKCYATVLAWVNVRRDAIVQARGAKRMRVVESMSLGERRFVSLVRVDQREFLIGASPAGVTILSELKEAETER